ncbi:MAG: DUF3267 domain-containing protein, partial [Erysipelotrichaceae bacterium]|nr:DUF3267 domain-containing protein [Erysipelotrichaceae bacterium]
RVLSEKERKRQEIFDKKCEEWISKGYRRTDLLIDILKANLFALLLCIPFFLVFGGAFFLVNRDRFDIGHPLSFVFLMIAYLAGIVVHELLHGITWARFTPHGMKDIDFGVMKDTMTPYCTCSEPLKKGQYILGTLMPLLVLGILPSILAVFLNSYILLLFGIIMSVSAAGDILIVWKILRYKNSSAEFFYMDHPTEAGGVIFEK